MTSTNVILVTCSFTISQSVRKLKWTHTHTHTHTHTQKERERESGDDLKSLFLPFEGGKWANIRVGFVALLILKKKTRNSSYSFRMKANHFLSCLVISPRLSHSCHRILCIAMGLYIYLLLF